MGQSKETVQLAVTFLPLVGIVLTAFLSIKLNNWPRWAGMIVVPLVTYAIYISFADALATKGSMVTAAVSMFYALLVCVYYLALSVFGALRWLRRHDDSVDPS